MLYMSFDSYIKLNNIEHLNLLGTIKSNKFYFLYLYIIAYFKISLFVPMNVLDCIC